MCGWWQCMWQVDLWVPVPVWGCLRSPGSIPCLCQNNPAVLTLPWLCFTDWDIAAKRWNGNFKSLGSERAHTCWTWAVALTVGGMDPTALPKLVFPVWGHEPHLRELTEWSEHFHICLPWMVPLCLGHFQGPGVSLCWGLGGADPQMGFAKGAPSPERCVWN